MESLVLVFHVLAAILIIVFVLLQQGKGADAGAAFGGGASQTVFGGQGGGSFFGKLTALLALIFFLTSFGLAFYASEKAKDVSGSMNFVPSATQVDDAVSLPEIGTRSRSSGSSDIPTAD